MTARRILGYLSIALSVLLALAVVGRLPSLVKDIFGVLGIFTGEVDAEGAGYRMGKFSFWLFHLWATYTLWRYGRKWSRKKEIAVEPRADA